jgi:hypothetical protein
MLETAAGLAPRYLAISCVNGTNVGCSGRSFQRRSTSDVNNINRPPLCTRSTSAGTQARVERRARETEGQQNYWRYGLMLLMATLVVEAFVGSR